MTEPIKHEADPDEDDDEPSAVALYNRQHDHFECEGPGLASMLRELVERGLSLPVLGPNSGTVRATAGAENPLLTLKREAEAAVAKHRRKKRWAWLRR